MTAPRGRRGRGASSRPAGAGIRRPDTRRPGTRRPARRPGRGATPRPRRPLFTGRAVVLGGLVLLLALTLAGPLRSWVSGRSDIDRLTAEGRALDARAAELQAELARQADPAFQARAARERLTYVLPGDRLVVVVDGQAAQGDAGTLPSAPDPAGPGGPTWYDRLMGSVAAADGDPAG